MALRLHPLTIGEPNWRELQPGEATTTLTQWYNANGNPKSWKVVPWFTEDGYLARVDSPNYRVPVSRRAKWDAWWAAAPKWIWIKMLRRKAK